MMNTVRKKNRTSWNQQDAKSLHQILCGNVKLVLVCTRMVATSFSMETSTKKEQPKQDVPATKLMYLPTEPKQKREQINDFINKLKNKQTKNGQLTSARCSFLCATIFTRSLHLRRNAQETAVLWKLADGHPVLFSIFTRWLSTRGVE